MFNLQLPLSYIYRFFIFFIFFLILIIFWAKNKRIDFYLSLLAKPFHSFSAPTQQYVLIRKLQNFNWIWTFNSKCPFGKYYFCQLILLFKLFLLLFMSLTAFFGTILEFHCSISVNFYLYLQYFQQKVFNFSKKSGSQTNSKSVLCT